METIASEFNWKDEGRSALILFVVLVAALVVSHFLLNRLEDGRKERTAKRERDLLRKLSEKYENPAATLLAA